MALEGKNNEHKNTHKKATPGNSCTTFRHGNHYISLEPEDIEKAQTNLPAGVSLMQFGLPGDRAVSEEGIEFLLWAEA